MMRWSAGWLSVFLSSVFLSSVFLSVTLLTGGVAPAIAAEPKLELKQGDHICLIGNTLADRMQHDGWLETRLQSRFPRHELVIRNLGYAADEVNVRPREQNFGDPDKHLTHSKADVIFAFFGYNESFAGEAGAADFRSQVEKFLEQTATKKYNGQSAPRVVLFSPIAHENLKTPNLPDGQENNARLERYTQALAEAAAAKGVPFVDLFHPTLAAYAKAQPPLTINGIHLTDDGNRVLAGIIDTALFGARPEPAAEQLARLREAVLDKNFHWFNRYRVTDGYNVYGGRSGTGNYDGQTNATISQRELEIVDVKTANRDRRIWAIAQGGDLSIDDSNTPPPLTIKTNRPGKNDDGSHPFLSGEDAIAEMVLHDGMSVNLFASEERFPRLVNPVQSSVDADGRLWVAAWPSYPHWHPNETLKDCLLILPDDDHDGRADRCIVFADQVHNPTGFEFWGGGVIVAAAPDLLFLKDTDGDDVADVRIRILNGIDSADTHHTANSFVFGPDGGVYFQSGIFQVHGIESPWGRPFRNTGSGVYRFDPLTHVTEFHFGIGPNPHGDVIDRWGFQFVSDGTSGTGQYVAWPRRGTPKQLYVKQYRPVPGLGLIQGSHFPDANQGNLLIANAIGFQGVAQYRFVDQGSGFHAEQVQPIVYSKDPNFRPTSLRIGGDGALYVTDWQNPLIGHLQHNLRDPNRDHRHGRVYRVTAKDRPLRLPVAMRGKPFATVAEQLGSPDDDVRYRARLELTRSVGHPYNDTDRTAEALAAVTKFAATLDPADPRHAAPLTEALFVHSMLHVVNEDLLGRVLKSPEGNARAAAMRLLRDWHAKVKNAGQLLLTLAADANPRVRCEAVIAATYQNAPNSAEVAFLAAQRPTDQQLTHVLNEATKALNVDKYLADEQKAGRKLSAAARQYALRNASVDQLLSLEPDEAVYRAVLSRSNANARQIETALTGLRGKQPKTTLQLALDLSDEFDAKDEPTGLSGLARFLSTQPAADLRTVRPRWRKLATQAKTADGRRLGLAAWMAADGSSDDVFSYAGTDAAKLRDVLAAAAIVETPSVRESLYDHVSPLLADNGLADAALEALALVPARDAEKFRDLAVLIKAGRQRAAAMTALKKIPDKQWPKNEVRSLVDHLVAYVSELPPKQRTQAEGKDAAGLARQLAKKLPKDQAAEIEERLEKSDVRIIPIGTVPERMIYDKSQIVIQAGKPVEFRFSNTDFMPHNLAIVLPGTLEEIGLLAESTAQTPDAAQRQYIPKSPHVLLASRLLQPGQSQALPFEAPKQPGVYPIVCTYPGHWRRMYAALWVVDDLKKYDANPAAYAGRPDLAIRDDLLKLSTQGREWKLEELQPAVAGLAGRSFEVGKSAFKVANCVACHKLNGEGNEFGPDLAKLDAKLGSADIVLDILDPSKRINEKFQSTTFQLGTGRVLTGLIVGETPEAYQVVENPLARGKPLTLPKADIEEQAKAKVSLMPKGLLDKLSKEEILDLVAYLTARGNKQHAIFQQGHQHHH